MGDETRHSEGIWRSIFIYSNKKNFYNISENVSSYLEKLQIMFSFQYYYGGKTKDHLTFRINFKDISQWNSFKEWMKIQKYRYKDHNYDEEYGTKLAYVLGTHMARSIRKQLSKGEWSLSPNFYRLMFHGMFNNLWYGYQDECSLYMFLTRSMMMALGIPEKEMPKAG